MPELDPNLVYAKLEGLAVKQAEMLKQMEFDSRANWDEHTEIRERLDIGNGHVADIRTEFDQKVLADNNKDIASDAIIGVVKRGIGAVIILITVMSATIPVGFVIVGKIW